MTKHGDSQTKKTLHELAKEFPNKTYICESGKISEIDLKNKNINTIYK